MSADPTPPQPDAPPVAPAPAAAPPKPKPSPFRALAVVAGLGLIGFGVWYWAFRGPTDDPGRWQGEWQLAVPAFGPDGQLAQRTVPGITVEVRGDVWAYTDGGKTRRRYLMTLRPEASPKEIDLTLLGPDGAPTPFVLRGIYEIERYRARVSAAPDPNPRPTEFDIPDAGTLWLLQRVE